MCAVLLVLGVKPLPQFFHVHHNLQRSPELYSQTLHERLVGEKKECRSIHFLLVEDVCVVSAFRRELEVLDHLFDGPAADVCWKPLRYGRELFALLLRLSQEGGTEL